ncbi:MAG: hypothetical protein LBQ59_02240, partial [Candidatus Peribacteria bacterium]|nr:hypothetical protein [Candidatus Peribacteria bacterium]
VIVNEPKKKNRLFSSGIFFIKYIATSSFIFLILLVSTNYSAYMSIVKSYVMKEKVEETKNSILNSVEAAKISDITTDEKENVEEIGKTEEQLSINKYKKELDSNSINLDINITTLDNRIIIPKM